MTTVTLMGAGGKMGLRITDNLKKSGYAVRHVEISEQGRQALAQRGVTALPLEEALDGTDVVILAVPDRLIGKVSHEIEPCLKPDTLLVALDAAAPYAGEMPDRPDLWYFVTHPCHPPVISDETDPRAQKDFFGGVYAKQHIVCALQQGPEEAYALGEQVARTIYAPVMRAHRCTVEQMAILEPVLSETVAATCLALLREAMEEAVRRGVPAQAAFDFLFGHLKVELGIVFQLHEDLRFSDGALMAIEEAKKKLFQPDWKKVFDREAMEESIRRITDSGSR